MDLFDQKGIQPMLISEQVEPYDDDGSIFVRAYALFCKILLNNLKHAALNLIYYGISFHNIVAL